MNFNFFGMNLATVPSWKIWENFSLANLSLVLLVFVSAGTGFLFSLITMKTNKVNNPQAQKNEQMETTNKTMMYTMPLMSLGIGFIMPAGLCVYWIANNLLSMIQEQIAGRILKKDYEAARLATEERERQEKIDEKERKEQARLDRARRIEEEKNRGKKKTSKAQTAEAEGDSVRKSDSRVGMRTYARGRSYDPNRFGGVTPYRDSSTPTPVAQLENNAALPTEDENQEGAE